MNYYYHAFTVGFNWWMIIVPIFVGLTIVLTRKLFVHKKEDGRTGLYQWNPYYAGLYIVPMAVIVTTMFFKESYMGAIQVFDNCLTAGDSPVYSIIFAPFAIVAFGAIFCVILFYIAGKTHSGMRNRRRKKGRH